MDRKSALNGQHNFPLKNGVPYTAVFGYNLYEPNYYDIDDNTLFDEGWNARTPQFYAVSNAMDLVWYDIEGAYALTAAGVAAVAAYFF